MKSLTPKFLQRLGFNNEDIACMTAISKACGRQQLNEKRAPEVLRNLRTHAQIESTQSSNRLEGVVAEKRRIKELMIKGCRPENRSEVEIMGYQKALTLIHDSYEGMPFKTNVIRQIHQYLYRALPQSGGKYKQTYNDIVTKDSSGEIVEIRFRTVPAHLVRTHMDDLIDLGQEAFSKPQMDSLVVIPLIILDFLCIHPFPDGNGRTARLLTLLLLYKQGFRVGRFISLERIIEETKDNYYYTLKESSKKWHEGEHDPFPWMRYFWSVLQTAYNEFESRVDLAKTNLRKRGVKTALLHEFVAQATEPFTLSSLKENFPHIGRNTIQKVLGTLKDKGQLDLIGRGRGAKWQRNFDRPTEPEVYCCECGSEDTIYEFGDIFYCFECGELFDSINTCEYCHTRVAGLTGEALEGSHSFGCTICDGAFGNDLS